MNCFFKLILVRVMFVHCNELLNCAMIVVDNNREAYASPAKIELSQLVCKYSFDAIKETMIIYSFEKNI